MGLKSPLYRSAFQSFPLPRRRSASRRRVTTEEGLVSFKGYLHLKGFCYEAIIRLKHARIEKFESIFELKVHSNCSYFQRLAWHACVVGDFFVKTADVSATKYALQGRQSYQALLGEANLIFRCTSKKIFLEGRSVGIIIIIILLFFSKEVTI